MNLKWTSKLAFLVMLLSILVVPAVQAAGLSLVVNGKTLEVDSPPIKVNGYVMVPLQFIEEAFGADIKWNGTDKTATVSWDELTLLFTVGKKTVKLTQDEKITEVQIDQSPLLKNGRIMVPVRFIAETFGAVVEWDKTKQTVIIISSEEGPAGPQGQKGETGPQGPKGDTGPQGPSGSSGSSGSTGSKGDKGDTGATGAKGDKGDPGEKGKDGVAGKDGATGPAGKDGIDGKNGATGPAGKDGIDGKNGATGPAGKDGIDGKNGATGSAGPAGKDGINGKNGTTGPAGKDGNDGKNGATGPAGKDGIDGKNGVTGSAGPAGKDGNDGATGLAGPAGPVGPAGPQGPQGIQGPQASTIIPFASGDPISLTTINGGLSGQYAALGFGNSVSGLQKNGNGVFDITSQKNFAFTAPKNGVIRSLSAFFSTYTAQALLGTSVSINVELYQATSTNLFTPVSGTLLTLFPQLTGIVSIGAMSEGTLNNLNIPVTAGTRYMLVFSATSTGLQLNNSINGYASAGIEITL